MSSKLLESLARPEGFEPPTPRFEAWCSIQLSYGHAVNEVVSLPTHNQKVKLRHEKGMQKT